MRTIDKIDQLIERLNQNLSDYHKDVLAFDRPQILNIAGKINAIQDTHFYLTEHHAFSYEQADYLLQFKSPLLVVADAWQKRTEDISDLCFALEQVFDHPEHLTRYPLIKPKQTSVRAQLTQAAKEAAARPAAKDSHRKTKQEVR